MPGENHCMSDSCMEYRHRMTADHQPVECTECDGEMLTLSKPQE